MEQDVTVFQNRARGCLLGLAIGDALGVPAEFKKRGSFPEITDYRGGGDYAALPEGLQPGYWTDDTSMALAMAESLLTRRRYDAYDVLSRYKDWWDYGTYSSIGFCFDIGNQTIRAIEHFADTGRPYEPHQHIEQAASNGAIMRIAPVVIAYALTGDAHCRAVAVNSSVRTHPNAVASGAAAVMTDVLRQTLTGPERNPQSIVELAKHSAAEHSPELFARLNASELRDKEPQEISSSGFVIDSLEAALWSVARSHDFESAVLTAVNLGDDADTVGAITGQLAGALYGLGSISGKLISGLHMKQEITAKADELYKLAHMLRLHYVGNV